MASKFKKALSAWAKARVAAERQKTMAGKVKADRELNARFSDVIREFLSPNCDESDLNDLIRMENWTVKEDNVYKMKNPKK